MTPAPVSGTSGLGADGGDLMVGGQCRATAKATGERCRRHAIRGGRVCQVHGGASASVKAAAARRVQEAEAVRALGRIWNPDAAPVTNPVEALARLAGQLQHAVNVLGGRLELESLDGATALAWSRVLRELRQGLVAMEGLGIQQKQVQLSETTGQLLAWVVRTVLDRIGVTGGQMVLAGEVVPAVFREVSTMDEAALLELGS